MTNTKDLCKPDRRNESFGITLEYLQKALSEVPISGKIPQKIQEMLVFAKKICLYAYFEYDFYTLCAIYLSLLAETAIKERFLNELPQKINLIKKGKSELVMKNYNIIYQRLWNGWTIDGFQGVSSSLGSILKWFKEYQILPQRISEREVYVLSQLRNDAAHLARKDIYTPGMVIPIIWKVIDFVNCLFDSESYSKEPNAIRKTREYYNKIFQKAEKVIKISDRNDV